MRNTELYIDIAKGKGRGVFTAKAIPAETIIEVAPVIVMSAKDQKAIDETLLYNYIFEWTPPGKKQCCMALGYVPLYNHSYESNCEYYMDYERDTIEIKTVRDIKADEELTVNYNGDWNDNATVWFDLERQKEEQKKKKQAKKTSKKKSPSKK